MRAAQLDEVAQEHLGAQLGAHSRLVKVDRPYFSVRVHERVFGVQVGLVESGVVQAGQQLSDRAHQRVWARWRQVFEHGRRARNGCEVHANRPIRLAIRPEPGRHRRAARTERTQHALFLLSALTGTPTRSRIAKTLGDDAALGIERHTPPGRHAQIGFGTHDRTVSAS